MSNPIWVEKMLMKVYPQRFIMARMTKLPLLGRLVDRIFFGGDDVVYLPKDQTIVVGEEIEDSENVLLPSRVLDYFIEKANYLWIMNTCICREATKCKDFPIDLGCLFLGEAAMDINPKLGHRATREEALEHARRCREAGLFQLIGRNKLDARRLNVRPGNKLMTVCNCCPCCCLWRILPVISSRIGDKIQKMPGVKVTVTDRCVGCGTCTQGACIVDNIRLQDGHAVLGDACRGCGHCVTTCPEGAIELTIEDTDFMDSLIPRISSLVDVT